MSTAVYLFHLARQKIKRWQAHKKSTTPDAYYRWERRMLHQGQDAPRQYPPHRPRKKAAD